MDRPGKLVIVVGPTGSGKGSIWHHYVALHPEVVVPVSYTTRLMRPGETDGKEYHFITREEFEQKIGAGDLIEWALYGGNYYGTPKKAILDPLAAGKLIILEIEVQGVRKIREVIPASERKIIFIDAGSWDRLAARVRARAPISSEELEKRRLRYEDEISFKDEADIIIENPDGGLEKAQEEFAQAVDSALERH